MHSAHTYEIWWVDRDDGPDVKRAADDTYDNQHDAVAEIVTSDSPASGHYVVKRFEGNSPAGEIVARPKVP